MYSSTLSLILASDAVSDQRHAPTALSLERRKFFSLYGRLGGPQDRPGRVRKFLRPPGVYPDYPASRCGDCAIPAHMHERD